MTTPPPPGPAARPADTTVAALAHAGGIFVGFLAPLLVYLLRDDDPYAKVHARAALNMHISYTIWFVVSAVLSLVVIGLFAFLILVPMFIICQIIGAVKASNGESYSYPLTLELLK